MVEEVLSEVSRFGTMTGTTNTSTDLDTLNALAARVLALEEENRALLKENESCGTPCCF